MASATLARAVQLRVLGGAGSAAAAAESSMVAMPLVAFGTGTQWFRNSTGNSNTRPEVSLETTLVAALDAGITHIDAAEMYETEQFTGPAFQRYLAVHPERQRKDFFLTSKVWRSIPDVEGAVRASLAHFGTDYLDLYLLHAPFLKERGIASDIKTTWQSMESLVHKGMVRAIGVSNFGVSHLQDLLSFATIRPAVNQIECHPRLYQPELERFCWDQGITLSAYAGLKPLSDSPALPSLQTTLDALAQKYNSNPATILLRWNLQLGHGIITTTSKPERLASIWDVYAITLTTEEMSSITAAGTSSPQRYFWGPEFAALHAASPK